MDQDFLAWLQADVGSRALEVWHSGLQMRDESSEPTETSLKSIYLWETLWIPQISATKMHMYISAWYQWCLLWYWKPIPVVISAHFNPERREKAKKLQFGDLLPKIPCRSYLGVNAATASGLSNQWTPSEIEKKWGWALKCRASTWIPQIKLYDWIIVYRWCHLR